MRDFYEGSAALAAEGRLVEALGLARQAAEADPGAAEGHAQVGALLAALYRGDEALAHLERALAVDPYRADVFNNIGAVHRTQGDLAAAQAAFERAVEISPSYLEARKNLAATHAETGKALWSASGDPEMGIGEFRRAILVDPACDGAWADLGNALVEAGRVAEAAPAFLEAIRLAPERAECYRYLAEVDPSAVTAEHVAALEGLDARDGLSERQKIEVNFALGKIVALRGEPEQAFTYLSTANAAARSVRAYDEVATLKALDDIAEVFDAAYMRMQRGDGYAGVQPVFIFGMPRSGTTLVEQILASHPDVYAAGELTLFEDVANELLRGDAVLPYAIGERYCAELAKTAPADVRRVTDKMPANFRYAGLIRLALPYAHMIHVRRDPIQTCLSCFANSFSEGALAYTYDLSELGRYYRGYERLMEHWRAVLPPGAMLEIDYEDIVGDLEREARRIVAYCGLPWDDRCLAFHETKRPVKTASAAQVRRSIYRSSLDSASAYGSLLDPLRAALEGR